MDEVLVNLYTHVHQIKTKKVPFATTITVVMAIFPVAHFAINNAPMAIRIQALVVFAALTPMVNAVAQKEREEVEVIAAVVVPAILIWDVFVQEGLTL